MVYFLESLVFSKDYGNVFAMLDLLCASYTTQNKKDLLKSKHLAFLRRMSAIVIISLSCFLTHHYNYIQLV